MSNSKILPIQSDPHFHFDDYCLDLQRVEEAEREDWLKRTMREDKSEPAMFRFALVALAAFVVVYVWPMIWRMAR